jgi:hypothetical protein
MTEMSKWFNEIADSFGPPPEDDLLEKINRLKQQVRYRARRQADIARQRDELLARVAGMLGITRDEYPDFFEDIE